MKPLVLAAALGLVALSATAQQPMQPGSGRPPMASFADFDLDGDGVITEPEFIEARNKRIGERAAEGRPMRGLSQAEEFKDIDLDGDGHLSREEFEAHQLRHRQERPRPPR